MKANITIEKGSKQEKWETVSSGGFPPMWKPVKDGESVVIRPFATRIIPAKGKRRASPAVDCVLLGINSGNFFLQNNRVKVGAGDMITIPLSYNLDGEDKLAVSLDKGKTARLSKLSDLIVSKNVALNLVFNGKVKGGQGTVKRFTIMVPQGFRAMLGSLPASKKAK